MVIKKDGVCYQECIRWTMPNQLLAKKKRKEKKQKTKDKFPKTRDGVTCFHTTVKSSLAPG